jgi:serine/threonine protein kinase
VYNKKHNPAFVSDFRNEEEKVPVEKKVE